MNLKRYNKLYRSIRRVMLKDFHKIILLQTTIIRIEIIYPHWHYKILNNNIIYLYIIK